MFLFLLIIQVLSGRLDPKTSRPILLSRNNAGSKSSYTFSYQISSYIPPDSILEVTFPKVFKDGLSLSSCKATNWDGKVLKCSVLHYTVSVSVGELSNANSNNTYNLTIDNIENPAQGGSSQFRLQLRRGVNILDYNDFFSDIGLVPSLSPISDAKVTCESGCVAGMTSSYKLKYKTTQDYESGTRVLITFPPALTLKIDFSCSSPSISKLSCSFKSNSVTFELSNVSVKKETELEVTFLNILNPQVSGNIGSFTVTVMAPVVNTVLEEIENLLGPSIDPNVIKSVSVCPGGDGCNGYYPYTALGNTQPYTLKIVTTNGVPKGGAIQIDFLTSFVLRENYCFILSGLKNQGYTEDDQILCRTNSNSLTITKFKAFEGGEFIVQVIATNPTIPGTYSTFTVTTKTESSKTIDTGSLGSLKISNIPHPLKWEVSFSKSLIVNSVVQMTVIFQPITNNMKSGEVSFNFHYPSSFSFAGTVNGYLTPHDVFPELVVPPTFSGSSVLIPSSTSSPLDVYTNSLNSDNRVRLAGPASSDGILLPSLPGKYFIEMILILNGHDTEAILYEVEVLADVMPGLIKSFSYNVNEPALYEVQFTPTITVPQGKVPEIPSNSWGTVDIRFPCQNVNLQNQWKGDLGTGRTDLQVVPCKAIKNIKPVEGDNLTCRLLTTNQVSPATFATVRVTNFGIIYKNVPVSIHLANISNPITEDISISATVVTYSITQRIFQEYNRVNFTFPRTFYLNSNPDLPKINGRSDPYGDGLNQVIFSPNTVGLYSMASFILWTESNILTGGHFYLKFPETYPLLQKDIRCFINYATELDCFTYPDAGWISILNLDFDMKNHVEYTFTLRYLKNPGHQEEPAAASMVGISEGVEIEYFFFSKFKYLDLGAVHPVNVYPSSYKANNVDTTYYFIFTLTNDLPLGSSIVLSFPKKDYVLDTEPQPECEINKALEPVDQILGLSCKISGTSLVIDGFLEYQGGTEITVMVFNILNPATMRTTDYFEIESYDDSGKLVDGNYIIDKLSIESEDTVGLFEYIDFYADPSNGLAVADYTISILPSRSIPNGSLIKIIFPQNEFSNITKLISCSLTGGLVTLNSCYGDGVNIVTVVTDSDYTKDSLSLPINITIFGVSNFGPRLTSGLLEVEISNTGVVIDSSPDSENNRKVTMGDQPGLLDLQDLMFYPKTSGEKAVFNFTFKPSKSFGKDCKIIVKFPEIFARDLSEKVSCFSSTISKNKDFSVKCVVDQRILKVYDTLGFDVNDRASFDLSVQHVRNPVVDSDSYIVFFTQCGYEMQDFGKKVFTESFSQVPTPAYLTLAYSKGTTTLFSQEYVKFTFNTLEKFAGVPDDLIFAEFPDDYDLNFIKDMIECFTFENNVSGTSKCFYEPNRIKIKAFESISTSVNNLTVAIQNIENPAKEQPARYVTLSFFEASSSLIVKKTYSNLNRVNPLIYKKQGIEVLINNLKPFKINLQTTIDNLEAKIPSGAQTSFSINGVISEKSCLISPNPINFNMRDFSQYFSVSCSSSAILGDHFINWYFLGTWQANYWSPIQRTYFSVVSTNQDSVSVTDIQAISLGGQSLPVLITLSHSPESSLDISLSQIGTLPTGVTIFPNKTSFLSGELVKSFRVSVSSSAIGLTGKIRLQKSGKNAEVYSLTTSVLAFDVGPKDDRYPVVVEYKDLTIGRVFASFSITLDEPCNVYWMVGRYGTRSPTLEEVTAGKLKKLDGLVDEPIFGSIFDYNQLQKNRFQYTIQVQGLLAQTNYTIHILAVDIGGNQAKFTPVIIFTTLDRHRSAEFQLTFNRTLKETEEKNALKKVAEVLGVSEEMVVKRTDFSGTTGSTSESRPFETSDYTSSSGLGRRLEVNVFVIFGLILPDPALDIKPLDLANSLNDHKAELAKLPGFNSSVKIIGNEVYGNKPVLRAKPRIGSLVGGRMTLINLALFEEGFISICVVVYNETSYNQPVPYQVNNLLDTQNNECNNSMIINANPIPVQVLFEGIEKDLEYRVLISAFNTLQGYPDYMWDVFVIKFTSFGMAENENNSFSVVLRVFWCLSLTIIS